MRETGHVKKFLLVSIIPHNLSDEEALKDLRELKSLVESYGGVVVDLVTQRREIHDKGMYIGSGKINESATIITQKNIDVVVLNAIVQSRQLYEMKLRFYRLNPQIEVWDKIDLILHIFSRHASTAEAKLQIELAAMRHMGPRIYGMGMVLSRQTGGIGGRGIGETNTELMKRHWREQIKKTKDSLKKISTDHKRQLERRRKVGFKTVSIIGYTNAGKTSVFNKLTGKKKLSQNILFSTLDSTVGRLYLPNAHKEILVSDTIGFIQNLPTEVIDAFQSTLMESIHADLLLHVIDISDENMERKIEIVQQILYELHIDTKKQIYVFNKTDAANGMSKQLLLERYSDFQPQFISAKTSDGFSPLLQCIEESI